MTHDYSKYRVRWDPNDPMNRSVYEDYRYWLHGKGRALECDYLHAVYRAWHEPHEPSLKQQAEFIETEWSHLIQEQITHTLFELRYASRYENEYEGAAYIVERLEEYLSELEMIRDYGHPQVRVKERTDLLKSELLARS